MNSKNILFSIALCLVTSSSIMQAQNTKVIAHRGFWNTQGAAQNSIASLVKADSIGCYGSEFDVWLTSDKKLVVNHDPSFQGVKMETSAFKACTSLLLNNGEHLPSLQEYVDKAKKLKTNLILELKAHSTSEQESEAVKQIVSVIKKAGLEKRIQYISFSINAVKEFIKQSPKGTPVFYLEANLTPKELKDMGCAGPDYHISAFYKHPEWIKECHELGLKVNVWTVNDKKDMKWLIDQKVDFITTNEPIELMKILKAKAD